MALAAGTIDDPITHAPTGLTKALYDAMDTILRPPLEESLRKANPPVSEEGIGSALAKAQANWKQLSYTLACGLVPALHTASTPPLAPAPFAETYSSSTYDPRFWKWFADFIDQLKSTTNFAALHTWLDQNPAPSELNGVLR